MSKKSKKVKTLISKSFNDKVQELFNTVMSFTKWITIIWLCAWIEVILFSEVATIMGFGDASALTIVNDSTIQIGVIICGFYFGTKCIENVAKGIEAYLAAHNLAITNTAAMPQFNQNEGMPPSNSNINTAYDENGMG